MRSCPCNAQATEADVSGAHHNLRILVQLITVRRRRNGEPHTPKGRCEEVMERFNDYAHQRRDLSCPCLGTAPTEQEFTSSMSPARYSKTPIKSNTSEPNLRDSAMEPPLTTKKTIHVTHLPQCAAMTRPWSPPASTNKVLNPGELVRISRL